MKAWQQASSGLQGPMEVSLACRTQAIHVPDFFNDSDISRVEDLPTGLGQEVRGGSSDWRVWFWQTGGRFPVDLEGRIKELAQKVAERERWDFKGSPFNLRVAEYHQQIHY